MDGKKVLLVVGFALLTFYLITQTAQAAEAVTTILGWLRDGVAAIVGFVRNVFG